MKHEIKYMTWKEAAEVFRQDPVLILPFGSMEVHGPHSPVGDFIAAEEIALEAAKRAGAYVLPVVPFGNSEYFRGFPGTISVRSDTLSHWAEDMVTSVLEHGVTKILLLNGHAGNGPALEELSRRIRRERGILIPRMDLWQMIPAELKKEIYGPDYKKTGHGGGTVDTVMQYLHPEAMRMDLYDSAEVREAAWQEFPLTGLGKTRIHDMPAFLPTNMEDMSRQGSLGAPLLGTPEGGKKVCEFLIGCLCEFVGRMQRSDMKIKG